MRDLLSRLRGLSSRLRPMSGFTLVDAEAPEKAAEEIERLQAHKTENQRLRKAIEAMQGHTFFCQDDEGFLRRWYPPELSSETKESK